MKSTVVVLLIALAALGVATVAEAQSTSSPSGTQTPAAAPPASGSPGAGGSVSTPAGEVTGQAPARNEDGSALPRAATERTTIFGLSPAAAVIIAAALLVVVILAIVAMTRSSDTYIDTNRRI
jgi:hypothetical protein